MQLKDWMNWEKYPWYIFYAPMLPKWVWYCVRARSLWFFTASNPTITFGGFEGEGKREIYEQLPPGSYPKTIYIQPTESFLTVEKQVEEAGFSYPFAVKPDIGMSGVFFRKIDSPAQFREYHSIVPVEYLVQEWIDYPMEVSVFYCRLPDSPSGEITGITRRDLLAVTGNGSNTMWELTLENPFALPYLDELKHKYADLLDWVIPNGETFKLFHAANRNRGAHLISLQKEVDQELLQFFDRLHDYGKVFFYGRYDIKCVSLEDLKKGKNYTILEYNGAGAGSNHIWHNNLSLWEAWTEVSRHWKYMYQISITNHKKGIPYWPLLKGARFLLEARKQFIFLRKRDASF